MKPDLKMTDEALLTWIGQRLASLRLSRNLTQKELAEQAGLGLRTVQRLELGAAAIQLSGFIRVCRVLGLVGNFESLIPDASASPMERLKRQVKRRQRARVKKPTPAKSKKWTWGDGL